MRKTDTKSVFINILFMLFFLCSSCKYNKSVNEVSTPEHLLEAEKKALILCSGCHGPTGVGTSPIIPNLAMQKKEYMIQQLMLYKNGKRNTHPPMTNISRMLTTQEIELISEWYSSRKGKL